MAYKLEDLSDAVRGRAAYRKQLQIEAAEWVRSKIIERDEEIERLVISLLDADFKVVDVAEAYTISGKTPNRNAIHEIKKRRGLGGKLGIPTDFPFEWVSREVETVKGTRTVWDVHATLTEYGPAEVNGEFTWRVLGGDLDPVLTEDEPYPSSKYYQAMLSAWYESNPYPGEQEQ